MQRYHYVISSLGGKISYFFFFSSRRRHTRSLRDWSSDVCSSDLPARRRSLRDGRQIFIDGERVADVTSDRRLAGAARSLAELYDMQHDEGLRGKMTFASPSGGAPVGLSFIEPRTVEDLIRRREMIKIWMDSTCGMFGRSPDFLNVMLTGLAASPMDFPLSPRLDEGDGLAVFDDVLVPWERVFIHRDPEMCNGLFQRTGAMPQVMHQTSTKNLAKAEFMLALGCAIARSTNIDAHLHVQGMLAELIEHAEFVRACLRASEADAAVHPASGLMTPADMPLWTVRMMFPKMFVRACEIIQILGAGGLVAVPSYAELSGPAAADVATYAQAANADAPTRVKLFRLAFDAAVSSFSGRQQLYERYYSGDPVRLAGALYAMYP